VLYFILQNDHIRLWRRNGEKMTEQERLNYKEVMSAEEKETYKRKAGEELDLKLKDIKGADELIDYLCHEYAKAEYIFNQKIEKFPGAVEQAGLDVQNIRERITNLTMYQHGWAYAHEGGGWYEMDYQQGSTMGWY